MTAALGRQQLGDLLLGTDTRLRPRIWLCLLASSVYIVWMGIHVVAVYRAPDLYAVPWAPSVLLAVELVGALAFYPLVRSGLTSRWQDPAMVAPQMVLAYGACGVGYLLIPDGRGTIAQIMCLIQVFGLLSLSPRQVLQVGAAAVASCLLTWVIGAAWAPPETFDTTQEALYLSMSAFIVTLLTTISWRYSRTRLRVREQKKTLAEAVARVEHIVSHDALTGLFNRSHMVQAIDRERARADRSGVGLAVVLLDLDHFKRINDTLGHAAGDDVLKAFADIAQDVLRETDIVGRWGGEEFIVLMPDTQPAERALAGLQRLQATLRDAIVCDAHPDLRITFSAGVAIPRPDETLDGVIERADQALYDAKHRGRDQAIVSR